VVARLLGETEAEEVGGQGGVLGAAIEKKPPVIRAGRKPVQEEKERAPAVALEDMNPPSVELLVASPLTPLGDAGGKPHG
jgi:hypothetical protein